MARMQQTTLMLLANSGLDTARLPFVPADFLKENRLDGNERRRCEDGKIWGRENQMCSKEGKKERLQ